MLKLPERPWWHDMDDILNGPPDRYREELAEHNDILRAEREAMVRIDLDALDEWLDSRDQDYDVKEE